MKKIKIRFLQKEDLEDIEQYFQEAVDKKNGFSLVAEKDGEVIGIIKVDEIELEEFFKKHGIKPLYGEYFKKLK